MLSYVSCRHYYTIQATLDFRIPKITVFLARLGIWLNFNIQGLPAVLGRSAPLDSVERSLRNSTNVARFARARIYKKQIEGFLLDGYAARESL